MTASDREYSNPPVSRLWAIPPKAPRTVCPEAGLAFCGLPRAAVPDGGARGPAAQRSRHPALRVAWGLEEQKHLKVLLDVGSSDLSLFS